MELSLFGTPAAESVAVWRMPEKDSLERCDSSAEPTLLFRTIKATRLGVANYNTTLSSESLETGTGGSNSLRSAKRLRIFRKDEQNCRAFAAFRRFEEHRRIGCNRYRRPNDRISLRPEYLGGLQHHVLTLPRVAPPHTPLTRLQECEPIVFSLS
jgi:hypothetical protein